jgi:hypothetical protein
MEIKDVDQQYIEDYYNCKCTTCRNDKDDLLLQLVEHWKTHFYKSPWLSVMNYTRKDGMAEGKIMRDIAISGSRESFIKRLVNEGKDICLE